MRLASVRGGALLAAGVALVLAGCGEGQPPAAETPVAGTPGDASAALRSEIEDLKRAVAEQPTDAATIASRARVLADWVDAHALAGRPSSPFAPDVRRYATIPPAGEALVQAGARVDTLVREYRLRDEEPEVLGSLVADTGPFVAGSLATITQTWTAGSRGMARGGAVWVARHFNTVYGAFQTDDPAAQDYVTVATTDADAVLEAEIIMAGGPHGGFRTLEPAVAFRVTAGAVDPGETVTVTYGDTSGGGPGLRITTVSGEHVPMPLYVDIDGSGDWFMLPLQPFEIVGAAATGVHGFAPSVVAAGEPFELSVRAEDDWYNRATGDIPGFEVWVNGEVAATTEPGTEAIRIVELSLDAIGPHWIGIRSMDGTIVGEANPVLVEEAPEARIYWGDTHGHSGYAEGIGTVDYFMRFARDDARLDFVTHSEHDTWLDEAEWRLMRDTVAQYDAPGEFVPYLGYEWTVPAWIGGGHHNVLFRTTEGSDLVSALEHPTLSSLYQGLRERYDPADVVVIPHAHNPGDARQSDPLLEPLIEVMSMHGTFEWFMRNYLRNGHQVGFVAASDDHLSHPGYAAPSRNSLAQRGGLGAVFARERTRDAIFDGMKARRAYATTGDRIILDVSLNGAGMGERTAFATERTVSGRVIGTAPIDTVTVFKNDEPIWSRDHLTATGAVDDGPTTLHLAFHSDATPLHWGDPPRGWRHWQGTVTLLGGTIVDARLTDEFNPNWQSLERDGNVLRFHTISRGDASTLVLSVTDLGEEAMLAVDLEETRETGSAPPIYRPPATIAGSSVQLPVAQTEAGEVRATMPIPDYDDYIALRRVAAGVRDVAFAVTDTSTPRQGDYYYVRVQQANDAAAWSSPIWVGGYPSR